MKSLYIQIVSIILILISGCQKADVSDKKTPLTSLKDQENKPPVAEKALPNTSKAEFAFNNNGDKIILKSRNLKKGSEVFNSTLSEPGIVTGTVFITVNSEQLPDDLTLSKQYRITKIVNKTYKLIVDKETELLQLKTKLMQHSAVQTVEIKIDYSPIESVR